MYVVSQKKNLPRQGTIYIAVLGVSLLVSIMGALAISVARLEMRTIDTHDGQQEARTLASSALEFAVNWIDNNSNWRTILTDDVESTAVTLGNGTFTWLVRDTDGALNDNVSDAVEVIGYGRVGDAVAVQRILLEPTGQPLTCLEAAFYCEGDVVLDAGSTIFPTDVRTDQFIGSGGNIDATASDAEIQGNAEAVGTITGSVTGTSTPGVAAREMPHEHVFEYYLNNGTWIDVTSVPLVNSRREIDKAVLSPASNPWGATNPEGIYVIDCQGAEIHVKSSRIVGTLVLLNNNPSSRTTASISWVPAVANYPCLMTENGFELRHSGGSLREDLESTNYNPPGTPYEDVEDADQTDSYPSSLTGVIYIGGLLRVNGIFRPKTCGVVIAPSVSLESVAEFDFLDTHFNYPPPGFSKGTEMRIVPGSWRRVSAN